jgi:hypothetical protein
VQRGDFAAAPAPLGTALERFSAAGPGSDAAEVFRGRWLAVRSLHVASNDHARYVPMLAELEASPSFASLPPAARVDHHMSSAYGALFADRWDETARRVGLALDLAGATADLASIEVLAQHLSPLLLGAPGVLDRMEAFVGWVDARFRTGPPLVRLGVHHQQALVAFVRGRYPEAVGSRRRPSSSATCASSTSPCWPGRCTCRAGRVGRTKGRSGSSPRWSRPSGGSGQARGRPRAAASGTPTRPC